VSQMRNKTFADWVRANTSMTAALMFAGLSNAECLSLLNSKILGHPLFSAPVSDKGASLLSFCGIITNLAEDIPQLIIQIMVLASPTAESSGILTKVSVFITGVSLLIGLFKRALLLLLGVIGVKDPIARLSHIAGRQSHQTGTAADKDVSQLDPVELARI